MNTFKKYLISFFIAVTISVILHLFAVTVYTDTSEENPVRYLVLKAVRVKPGEKCLYNYKNSRFTGRLIARAGDTVLIQAGKPLRNGNLIKRENPKRLYRTINFLSEGPAVTGDTLLHDSLSAFFYKDHVLYRLSEFPRRTNHRIFYPNSFRFRWNADYFGPLYIPRKNEKFPAATENISLYKNISEKAGDSLHIVTNACFLLNDNMNNIADSRVFGLIDENNITGKLIGLF